MLLYLFIYNKITFISFVINVLTAAYVVLVISSGYLNINNVRKYTELSWGQLTIL